MVKKTVARKKKIKKQVVKGKFYIQSSFNNTTITLTDEGGNVLSWATSGSMGYKGSRKSTPYAAGTAAKKVSEDAKAFQMQKVDIVIRGVGSGRESAVRAINASGIEVTSLKDITPIPHNGPRPKKPRRV